MSFFDLKVKCSICDNEVGLNRFQLERNVWICPNCLGELGGLTQFSIVKKMSILEIKEKLKIIEAEKIENVQRIRDFSPTKKIGKYFYLDESSKRWVIPDDTITGKIKKAKIFNFSDIIDYELLEDGETITKGGLGRAVAGGLLFGGVGAVVGGVTGGKKSKSICTKLQIKITVNDMINPVIYINFISSQTKTNGIVYKMVYNCAQEIISLLKIICDSQSCIQNNGNNINSVTEEIKKYKELLDINAITQAEFDEKKKQLLGMN